PVAQNHQGAEVQRPDLVGDIPSEGPSRDVWVYKAPRHEGWFEREHGRQWIESTSDGGEMHFEEVGRTPDYVELFDRRRQLWLRLSADHVASKQGENHPWSHLYTGHWVSPVSEGHMDELAALRARIREIKHGVPGANGPPPGQNDPNSSGQPAGAQGNQANPSSNSNDPLVVDLGHDVKMEFVPVKAGEFLMGSPDSDGDANEYEKPQHPVKITTDFYLAKYPVTQEQFAAITGKNPSLVNPSMLDSPSRLAYVGRGVDTRYYPIVWVFWDDASEFCAELTRRDKLGRVFSLPTEAEWEYAARAGTNTRYYFGDESRDLWRHGWFVDNSRGRPHKVGGLKPNPWGLYDMNGNVWQWCADRFGQYYADAGKVDPKGPEGGSDHVVRGGSWVDSPLGCRAGCRHGVVRFSNSTGERRIEGIPPSRAPDVGFRVAFRMTTKNNQNLGK
ncbi:MAG TPA: formylglycine-generating enzyme family protein, partial [Gemmataceae bacterium]|nr:formylglycine-generating enzyme family protein [Gemmataceae bacterium]